MAGAETGTAHGEPVDAGIVIPVYDHRQPLAHCLEAPRPRRGSRSRRAPAAGMSAAAVPAGARA